MRALLPTVVSYPGVMPHATQVALAFHEAGELQAYVTTLAFHDTDRLVRWLEAHRSPLAARCLRELKRRDMSVLPPDKLVRYRTWEALRTLASRCGASASAVDRIWNRMCLSFDRHVANRHVPFARRIYGFEYSALASFERARNEGVQTVLDLPSLDNVESGAQRDAGQPGRSFPENSESRYFERKFRPRYERRQREIALADVIITNSRLTAASHVKAGADPRRVRVVPLAGPKPVSEVQYPDTRKPLTVMCASGVSLRKGAHHFLEAWRRLDAGSCATAWLYGSVNLPESLLRQLPGGLEFRGAVPQSEVFEALARADVLVLPTLSDGFGMVVTEALAHGVPVITTDRAGAADRIEQGRNGFVVPAGDALALHEALQWCLDNRVALSRMREEAWKSAAQWQWSDYRNAIRKAVEQS